MIDCPERVQGIIGIRLWMQWERDIIMNVLGVDISARK